MTSSPHASSLRLPAALALPGCDDQQPRPLSVPIPAATPARCAYLRHLRHSRREYVPRTSFAPANGVSGMQSRPDSRRLQPSRSPAHAATPAQRAYPSSHARAACVSAAPPPLEREERQRRRRRRRRRRRGATATATARGDGDSDGEGRQRQRQRRRGRPSPIISKIQQLRAGFANTADRPRPPSAGPANTADRVAQPSARRAKMTLAESSGRAWLRQHGRPTWPAEPWVCQHGRLTRPAERWSGQHSRPSCLDQRWIEQLGRATFR